MSGLKRGRPRLEEPREVELRVRLTQSELDALRASAKKRGLAVAALVRRRMRDDIVDNARHRDRYRGQVCVPPKRCAQCGRPRLIEPRGVELRVRLTQRELVKLRASARLHEVTVAALVRWRIGDDIVEDAWWR